MSYKRQHIDTHTHTNNRNTLLLNTDKPNSLFPPIHALIISIPPFPPFPAPSPPFSPSPTNAISPLPTREKGEEEGEEEEEGEWEKRRIAPSPFTPVPQMDKRVVFSFLFSPNKKEEEEKDEEEEEGEEEEEEGQK